MGGHLVRVSVFKLIFFMFLVPPSTRILYLVSGQFAAQKTITFILNDCMRLYLSDQISAKSVKLKKINLNMLVGVLKK